MADDEKVLGVFVVLQELVEVLESCRWFKGIGLDDLGLVAGLGSEQRGGLEAALEGTGDDEVELDVQRAEDVGQLKAVPLAFLVEGPLGVEERIRPSRASARV